MKKKILKRTGYVLGVILVSALVALGAMYFLARHRVEETGNVLGVSWYNETEKEFAIDTVDELYEFARLSTYYNFKGQTIRLEADLVINEGNASEWKKNAPERKWIAINGFAGTFDGQGHTISGLYAKGYNSPIALFSNTIRECQIHNFKITNSYFEGKGFGGVASVVSNGGANLKQIYSDAIINVKGSWSGYAGGICSKLKSKSIIEECWFDGVIKNTGRNSGGIVDDVNRCEVQLSHCLFSGEIYSTWSVAIDNASQYYLSRTGGLVGRAVNEGARLVINDCLSSGNIVAEYVNQTGGVLGTAMEGSVLICNDTYTASSQYAPIGSSGSNGTMQSLPLEMSPNNLVGYKAYQWTTLDFENYWSVVEEGTPILKYFSENSPSIDGIKKAYDTSWYSETGSESVIMTPEQLYGFYILSSGTDFAGKTIKLGADIVCNEGKASSWTAEVAPENIWLPIGEFAGIFDGQNHTISGLYTSMENRTSVGLFATTDVKTEIKNLNLKNSYIQGKDAVGSIVGQGGGIFTNVQSNAIIVATDKAGGILGLRSGKEATLTNCTYSGRLSATGNNIGGMIGLLNGNEKPLKMNGCVFAGTVQTTADQAGGMIGGVGGKSIVEITGCRSTGTVAAGNIRAGGFIGTIAVATKVTISKSLSSATVTTVDKQAGGFIGYTEKETEFSQVQFSGKATGLQQVGGLIGAIRKTKVTADDVLITGQLHATRDTEADTRVGGLFGIIADGKPNVTVTRCLITGDITYVSNHKGDCGEQVGQIQTGKYIATGVYARKGCCDTGKKVGKGSLIEYSQCATLPAIFLQGATAVDAASALNISTTSKSQSTWVALKEGYPALRIFTNKQNVLSGSGFASLVDKSWYDVNKSEFTLTDAADLYGFTLLSMDTDFSGKTIKLGASVTLNGGDADTFETTAPDMPWLPINKFSGTFDGQGNSIKGVYVDSGDKVGLFSETTKTAVVKNLKLEEAYINGTSANGTGSIVGRGGGTFEAIYSDAIVKSANTRVGGIVGYIIYDTTMNQVQFAGITTAKDQTGGLASNIKGANVTFTDCLVSGTVATTDTTKGRHMNVGLLVGMIDENSDVAAIKCFAAGYLKPAVVSKNNYARALVGKVTRNNALFHGESVVIIDHTDHIQTENRDYIGVLNPKTDGVATYTNCGWKGKGGSGIKRLTIAKMTGINAWYNIGGFEFCDNVADTSKPWVVITDGVPQLRIFADVKRVVDLTQYIKEDTSWYDDAKQGVGESSDNPYIIADAGDLLGLSSLVNAGTTFLDCYIRLETDIEFNKNAPVTLEEWKHYTAKNTFVPIGGTTRFQGHFDGNDCKIRGIYIPTTDVEYVGLFGATDENAEIYDLTLENSYIAGKKAVGSIVGRGGGTFTNVHSNAVVVATEQAGGILGLRNTYTLTMADCSYNGELTATGNNAGGILGLMQGDSKSLIFTDCEFAGTVRTSGSQIGGFIGGVGGKSEIRITGCKSTGTVTAEGEKSGGYIGTIALESTIIIRNSESDATVTAGSHKAGGYIGYNQKATKVTIQNSTSGAMVNATGKQAGGFIGMTDKPVELSSMHFSGNATALQHVGGFVGAANNTTVSVTDGLMTGTVQANITTGEIEAGANQGSAVGGICGIIVNSNADIKATRCLITGTITCEAIDDSNIGEHVGRMDKGKYTADAVYVQKGCCASYEDTDIAADTSVGSKADVATFDIKETCKRLSASELKGDAAKTHASGLFADNNSWATQALSHPTLTLLSWYNPEKTEFYINSKSDLFEFAKASQTDDFAGKIVYLSDDIDVNEGTVTDMTEEGANPLSWTPIGTKDKPFAGIFDGQNHTISGIYINNNSNYQGLFSYVGTCTIQNLQLDNSYIKGKQNVGSIVGGVYTNTLTTIKHVTSSAYVTSESTQVGGILGLITDKATKVVVKDCTYAGTLVANGAQSANIGGIVGLMQAKSTGTNLEVINCTFSGNIEGGNVGGFVGGIGSAKCAVTITSCHFTSDGIIHANTKGQYDTAYNAGGIIGKVANTSGTTIKDCKIDGTVKITGTPSNIGKYIGLHSKGTVTCNENENTFNGNLEDNKVSE